MAQTLLALLKVIRKTLQRRRSLSAFSLMLASVACGSTVATTGPDGAGGEGGEGGAGGASSSSASTTAITVGVGGGGCGSQHEVATLTFDGIETAATVDSLWVAPTAYLDLCFMLPGDKFDVCTQRLTIFSDFGFEDGQTVAATASGTINNLPMMSEPDFMLTVADEDGLGLDGSFEGTMNDGTSTYPVSGTFTACPQATD